MNTILIWESSEPQGIILRSHFRSPEPTEYRSHRRLLFTKNIGLFL